MTAIVCSLDLLPENVNLNKVEAAVDRLTSAEMAVQLKIVMQLFRVLATTLTLKVYSVGLAY